MNCDKDYFMSKETERKQAKSRPVVGRVSRPGSTQPLQECVGGFTASRGLMAMNRQMLGVSRIVRRTMERPKQRRGE